ncbi:unnamed protein product, partial [Nesidiocoris tenuis]
IFVVRVFTRATSPRSIGSGLVAEVTRALLQELNQSATLGCVASGYAREATCDNSQNFLHGPIRTNTCLPSSGAFRNLSTIYLERSVSIANSLGQFCLHRAQYLANGFKKSNRRPVAGSEDRKFSKVLTSTAQLDLQTVPFELRSLVGITGSSQVKVRSDIIDYASQYARVQGAPARGRSRCIINETDVQCDSLLQLNLPTPTPPTPTPPTTPTHHSADRTFEIRRSSGSTPQLPEILSMWVGTRGTRPTDMGALYGKGSAIATTRTSTSTTTSSTTTTTTTTTTSTTVLTTP